MTKRSEQCELALYRSNLLRGKIRPRDLTASCAIVARHVARIDRWRLLHCNGIQRWDENARGVFASWTDADSDKCEKEVTESRARIIAELRPFLTLGCVWKWHTDPRAGVVARISDKGNRRDCFLGGNW